MKSQFTLPTLLILLGAAVLNACGAGAAATESPAYVEENYAMEAAATEAAPAIEEAPPAPEADSASGLTEGSVYETGIDGNLTLTTHLVIKSAEMRLLVEDSNVAIDRLTQIVGDTGGYIISSNVWNQTHLDGINYKYATFTIGVPVNQFERALNRLRGIAIQVVNENASGEDVTDQYVDLQSQLTNLEATRDRIKSFLEQSQNVDEALRINQQLSEIERQIEEIKGRINYLQDRSAFSTILVNIDPKLPEVIPPTVIPTSTPEPETWRPEETAGNAWKTLTSAYQNIIDILIWFFVVLVPIFAPPVIIVWAILKWVMRKPKKPQQ
ncbi:MAG TPA: DUF4349 domain-containing protein [Anaerolineales bacterium]|nr:DUF4349 domain-containing protein [Anaerolineales bacterium]HNA90232.1 DUF4349 domain-containing protein [Anaerolineales bacterium]HNC08910.1 DUF4349 domain-containing protein [Anaerolineales bacterium]